MADQPPPLFVGIVKFAGVWYRVWGPQDHPNGTTGDGEIHGLLHHKVPDGELYVLVAFPMQDGGGGGGGNGGGGNGVGGGGGDGDGDSGVLFCGFVEFSGVYYRVWGIRVGSPHNHPEHYGMVVHNGNIYSVVGNRLRVGGGDGGGGGDGDGGNAATATRAETGGD